MEFQDRILRCVDCGAEFVWTAGEQQFFADKNFKNEPKRCKACKSKAGQPPGGGPCRARTGRNRDHLLGVRQGDDGAFQANAGASGLLQGVLPVPEVCRGRRRLTPRFLGQHDRRPLAALLCSAGDRRAEAAAAFRQRRGGRAAAHDIVSRAELVL